jgi:NAD(P)-dependent dehydrogenase (short-subunit alcohol dehydrogenase family)
MSENSSVLDRFRLDGKVVLITGASSGLGVAFASACAQVGADVVVAARRAERLADTVALINATDREALAVSADVSVEADCRRIVEETMRRFGRLDVLVNNAGVEDRGAASRLTVDAFQRVIDVNLTACFVMAQAAAAVMTPGSAIVNVASILAYTTLNAPGGTAYNASKAGLLGLTRSLARQWTGRKGIRVNALLPGFFPSEMTTGQVSEEFLGDRLVMGRMGVPDELVPALVFLASDASSYMTGSELVVDGGFLLT